MILFSYTVYLFLASGDEDLITFTVYILIYLFFSILCLKSFELTKLIEKYKRFKILKINRKFPIEKKSFYLEFYNIIKDPELKNFLPIIKDEYSFA